MAKKQVRRKITDVITSIEMNGTPLHDMIGYLTTLKDENESKYSRIYFDLSHCDEYHVDIKICGDRLENDQEYEKRMMQEKIYHAKKDDQERREYEKIKAQYLKLAKKFEGKEKVRQITSTPEEFAEKLEAAKKIVDAWPDWKKKTNATSFPRPKYD